MNLIQNNVSIHERAIRQSVVVTQDKDDPPVVLSANGSLRGSVSSDNTMAAISMVIPRGKAVALPSIKITEEEEKNIERSFYGGKGDKPHLGGFTEFDVSGKYLLMSALILTYLTSVFVLLFPFLANGCVTIIVEIHGMCISLRSEMNRDH